MQHFSHQTLHTLASNPPPRRFASAKEAHARIQELETVLGIAPSKMICSVRDFTARIAELESMVGYKHLQATPPAAVVIAAPTATPAIANQKPELTGRDRFAAGFAAANTKPKISNPHLRGAARFKAAVRISKT